MIVSHAAAGEKLAEVIRAQFALDEAQAVRSHRVHLTAPSQVALRAVITFWAFTAIARGVGPADRMAASSSLFSAGTPRQAR